VHHYILKLKGKLAKWHVKVLVNEEQMLKRDLFVKAQEVPGEERYMCVENDVHVDEKWFYLVMKEPHCGNRRRVAAGLDPVNYDVYIRTMKRKLSGLYCAKS
jgi:hypothetical protein